MRHTQCSQLSCVVIDPDTGLITDHGIVQHTSCDGYRTVLLDDGEMVEYPPGMTEYVIDLSLGGEA